MLNKKTFKCKRCTECCKQLYVILSNQDIKEIEDLGHNKEDFAELETIGEFKGKYALKKQNNNCIFLEENNCKIYKNRPEICKKYPFFGEKIENCLNQTLKQ